MAEKRKSGKSDLSSLVSRYGKALLLTFLTTLDNNIDDFPQKIASIFHLKKTVIRIIVGTMLILVSIFLFLYGLGLFISSMFPAMTPGISQMLISVILLILIYIYTKYL